MNKIIFVTDGNELELVKKIDRDERGKKLPEAIYEYRYVKSETKISMTINFTEEQILKLLKNETIKKIEL
jgi:hypothetical protein